MLRAALYCRLSRDDGDNVESSSISSQKKFLAEYAKKNHYIVHDFYIDDGYSGTDFDRPDFKRMMQDVEKGNIQAIIVKDLSRFGRNYLKTGTYLEEYFPEKNIKFIAINDNYDSAKDDNEFAPFKNIMNEWYAKDISKKIKVTHKLNQEKGIIPTGKLPLYGYTYDKDRNRIPCKETAEIVKYIFETYAAGVSLSIIAKELIQKKVYVPGYWFYKNYSYNANKYMYYDTTKRYAWDKSMVCSILNQKEYNGDLIVRKTSKVSFKLHKQIKNDIDEVLIYRKKYEPLVDDETIEKVRKRQSTRLRTLVSPELSKFKGISHCMNCKHPLTFRKYNKEDYYLCHNDACEKKAFVSQDLLMKTLKLEVAELIKLFQQHKLKIMKYAENYIQNKKYVELKASPEEIKKLEERNQRLDILIGKLFESMMDGTLPEATYKRMLETYTTEQNENEDKIQQLSSTKVENQEVKSDLQQQVKRFFKTVEQLANKEELTFTDIQSFVDKIYVSGSKKNLEIQFIYNNVNIFIEEFKCNVLNH
ncbi:MAG: recombinase family protein [Anaeroplasmataceae bacterium]|nr:recombinase family protein [Anaeroplasmataceae bacterium]